MKVWIIIMQEKNRIIASEGYSDYIKARAAMLSKVEPEDRKIIDDFRILDLENELLIELKLVTIF